MRSAKDLKDIVSSQRANSKMNGIGGNYTTQHPGTNKENAMSGGGLMNKKYSSNAVDTPNDGDKTNA